MGFVRRKNWHPGFTRWYQGLTRSERVRYWFGHYGNSWDDWLCEQPSWASDRDWLYYFDGGWSRIVCLFLGHSPIPDHCGIPEHDYCSTCSKPTPNGATR